MSKVARLSHAANRGKVCAICLKLSKRALNSGDAERVRLFILANFDPSVEAWASGICGPCSSALYGYKNGDFRRSIRISPELFAPQPYFMRRDPCFCVVCEASRGNLPKSEEDSTEPAGMQSKAPSKMQHCETCYARIYVGESPFVKLYASR